MNIRKWGHMFWDYLTRNSAYISAVLFLVLSIIDISDVDEKTCNLFGVITFPSGKIFYYFIVGLTFLFILISIENKKAVEEFEKEVLGYKTKINDLESSYSEIIKSNGELFNSYLKLILRNLDFKHTERISVYKVFDNQFILIGRSSMNPLLKTNGRNNYPIKEGFICKGWEEIDYRVSNLPDPTINQGDDYYNAVNAIKYIERGVVDSINMKSRSYFVYRIDGYEDEPTAIVVFESLKPDGLDFEKIINTVMGVKEPLIMFVEKNNGINLQKNNLDL